MIILDGKKASQGLVTDLKQKITQLKAAGTLPTLAAILVGDDPASQIYLRSKKKRAAILGVRLLTTKLPDATSTAELTTIIQKLNQDDHIHAIMLEMPLPAHINSQQLTC